MIKDVLPTMYDFPSDDYDEATIMEWKNKLGADDWYINVKRNQLRLTYYIHF